MNTDIRPCLARLASCLQEARLAKKPELAKVARDRADEWLEVISELTGSTLLAKETKSLEESAREAAKSATPEDAELAAAALLGVSIVRLSECDSTLPRRVLWRDPDPKNDRDANEAIVISAGQIGVLSGAGGDGKSTITLAVAAAAANAHAAGEEHGSACGLRVAAGPVLVASAEDAPAIMLERLSGLAPTHLYVWTQPSHLWEADPSGLRSAQSGPSQQWGPFWGVVRNLRPSLVILDPANSILSGASVSETSPVQRFLTAASQEAENADCGVLVVAHSNKQARDQTSPGAGAIAGSAAWHDRARGVLHLKRDKKDPDTRVLTCIKANYGRAGWSAHLREKVGAGGVYEGLEAFEWRRGGKPEQPPNAQDATNNEWDDLF